MLQTVQLFFANLLLFMGYLAGDAFKDKLPAEEEERLLCAMQGGDSSARDALIEHNLRLVAYVAKKYRNSNFEMDDLISMGVIGLIKGVDTYKLGHKTKLGTYLVRCIANEILMALRAEKPHPYSLENVVGRGKDGQPITLGETLNDNSRGVDEVVALQLEVESLQQKMGKELDEREKTVIIHRHGLFGAQKLTQEQISQKMGISRSYVSRIERSGLEKLKKKCMH